MSLYNTKTDLIQRYEYLSNVVKSIEAFMPKLPDGRIRLSVSGDTPHYYYVDAKEAPNGRFLRSDEKALTKKIAQRSYLDKVLKYAKEEMMILEKVIRKYPNKTFEDVYPQLAEARRELITPVMKPDDEFVRDWLSEEYERKPIGNEVPMFVTIRGERVRSKSEMIIADHLYINGVPYKYEYPVVLPNGRVIHPDFKLLRVRDRTEKYHEHFGMMEDPDYAANAIKRIKELSECNIILGMNLTATFESAHMPLDVRLLDKYIKETLL